MNDLPGWKERARARIEESAPALFALSRSIHARPEQAFAEHYAMTELTALAESEGFAVTRGVAGLDTAFTATAGAGDVRVGFCAEYDALPDLGHACGHNIIAAMSAGAALGAAAVAAEAGLTLHLFGTPGEEVLDGGGKIVMFDAGCFDGLDALLMAHPAPVDLCAPALSAGSLWRFTFRGRGGHALDRPAAADDAMLLADLAVALLQRRLPHGCYVRGTRISSATAPNVASEEIASLWTARAPAMRSLLDVGQELRQCFEAAALATGARLEIAAPKQMYAEMHHAPRLTAHYRRNAEALGRRFADPSPGGGITTDLGNVSLSIPAIHPYIAVRCDGAVNHDRAFAAVCGTPAAEPAILDGAIALAWTALDLAADRRFA